jgi:uncharacterized membrane protein YhaH (DUF805 family)
MEYVFLPLKRYAEFSGRSRRMEYWMFTLFVLLMWIVLGGVFMAMAGSALMAAAGGSASGLAAAGGGAMVLLVIMCVVWLALLIPSIAVGIRRLHDTNRSGWWLGGYLLLAFAGSFIRAASGSPGLSLIISLATLVYAIAILVFMCLDGTKGPNRYGPDPKGQVDAQVFA